jgi:hypothetical protein
MYAKGRRQNANIYTHPPMGDQTQSLVHTSKCSITELHLSPQTVFHRKKPLYGEQSDSGRSLPVSLSTFL